MKNLNIILLVVIAAFLHACGSSNSEENSQNADSTTVEKDTLAVEVEAETPINQVSPDEPYIIIESGGRVVLEVGFAKGEKVWADFNKNQQFDEGEELENTKKSYCGNFITMHNLNEWEEHYDGWEGLDYREFSGTTIYGKVTYLFCPSSEIYKLDVSHNPYLEVLFCGDNRIKDLDLTKNANLKILSCEANGMTNLNISQNAELEEINCSRSSLTNIKLSHNKKLKNINCLSNQLTNIDLSHNTELEQLNCSNNSLTNIDLSHNPKIQHFYCSENKLTNIDISNNLSLRTLICDKNPMTDLEISKNDSLQELILPMSINTNLYNFERRTCIDILPFLKEQNLLPEAYHIVDTWSNSLNENEEQYIIIRYEDNVPYSERKDKTMRNNKLVYYKVVGENKYEKVADTEDNFIPNGGYYEFKDNKIIEYTFDEVGNREETYYIIKDGKIIAEK